MNTKNLISTPMGEIQEPTWYPSYSARPDDSSHGTVVTRISFWSFRGDFTNRITVSLGD